MPKDLISSKLKLNDIVENQNIELQQKKYILEASTEFLEYSFSKNDMNKAEYLDFFHNITTARAALGQGKKLEIQTPPNPIESHRAIRMSTGFGFREDDEIGFLGIRPAYHDLEDSNYGFLRGTQIEFFNLLLSYSKEELRVEDLTILSIASLAQRSEFFNSFSWRTKFGFDRNYIDDKTNFIGSVGFGYSWGNELAYIYTLVDPLFYLAHKPVTSVGGTLGLVLDKYTFMSTNIEVTKRFYDSGKEQFLGEATQSFRLSQNLQLKFNFDYKEKYHEDKKENEETFKAILNYYF
jgi:hypothetical protein